MSILVSMRRVDCLLGWEPVRVATWYVHPSHVVTEWSTQDVKWIKSQGQSDYWKHAEKIQTWFSESTQCENKITGNLEGKKH